MNNADMHRKRNLWLDIYSIFFSRLLLLNKYIYVSTHALDQCRMLPDEHSFSLNLLPLISRLRQKFDDDDDD